MRARGTLPGEGTLLLGSEGIVYCDSMHGGSWYLAKRGEAKLLGVEKHAAAKDVPQTMPRAKDHYHDFLAAVNGGTTQTPFPLAAQLVEMMILGTIAARLSRKALRWDAAAGRFIDAADADALLTPVYRPGWSPVMPG